MIREEQLLAELRERLPAHPDSIIGELAELIVFLEASQYALIQLMEHNGIWDGAKPADPGGTGELEFGLVPYWIAHPPAVISSYLRGNKALQVFWDVLEFAVPSLIDTDNYLALKHGVKGQGLVAGDGTLYSELKYAQMDPDWLWALLDYLITRYVKRRLPPFRVPPAPVALADGGSGRVTIGIIGDWGTGDALADQVMAQLLAQRPAPDYLVHLGDVYYAGTGGDYLPLREEQDNFLGHWPDTGRLAAGRSFTLNSNHEMYSNAEGYFRTALADPRFAAQAGASCFALQYAGWTLLGLDSAYYASDTLYMQGALGGSGGDQGQWLKGLGLTPEQCIVFTHHTGLDYQGRLPDEPGLWAELSGLLGGDPAAWYWGHIHNAMAYDPLPGHRTLPRCVGHGAIPFGAAWGLEGLGLPYYAHTPLPGRAPQVANGFAVLTLDSGGQVTEAFYELGTALPVYRNSYAPRGA